MRPLIAVTLGDPAGIGPEITVKAAVDHSFSEKCRLLVIGDEKVLKNAAAVVGRPDLEINVVEKPADGKYCAGCIDIVDMKAVDTSRLEIGKVSAMAGEAAFQYVKKAIELAMAGEVDATVTNALNKEALNLAGRHYSGHTEIYGELTKTENYTMMLAHQNLRVVHVSTHVSLREACSLAKKERILKVIRIADSACRDMGIEAPRIGVAGLNPHCGENGLFGREELEEIIPAVSAAREEGIDVYGPIPADTIFSKARGGWYDVVVAMYHDQGHIPLKAVGFVYNQEEQKWDAVEGVNITLGLPIIRTSVDHGTAFDQAGSGMANEFSLLNAIDYAIDFARNRGKNISTQNGGGN